jgi:hypothetical protein
MKELLPLEQSGDMSVVETPLAGRSLMRSTGEVILVLVKDELLNLTLSDIKCTV